MIIPPDPEKDPNIFSASSSTPSLVPPPSEVSDFDHDSSPTNVTRPRPAHTTNHAFGYPFGDDLGVGYSGEALPPYERQRMEGDVFADPSSSTSRFSRTSLDSPDHNDLTRASSTRSPTHGRGAPVTRSLRRSANRPSVFIPSSQPHIAPSPLTPDDDLVTASSSTAQLPLTNPSSSTPPSTSKLWEGSSYGVQKRPNANKSKKFKKWWKKWRKWVYVAITILVAGIGVLVGVLVGLKAGSSDSSPSDQSPWQDNTDGSSAWVTSGESLNVTFVASRDGPCPDDGTLGTCPKFTTLNATSPLNLLSTPYPAMIQQSIRLTYPFQYANDSSLLTLPDFTFIARGLGSSGTVEIVGSDAPDTVVNGGQEGNFTVDVIAEYSGFQDLDKIIQVCSLERKDGNGIGIFTPTETDGKVSNAYMLNPMLLPSFHVVIRLPPSAVRNSNKASLRIPSLTFEVDRMAVRFGDLEDIVDFGEIVVNSGRGGVYAVYAAAETINIWTGQNSVRGTWNVSNSIMVNSTGGSIMSDVILYDPTSSSDESLQVEPHPIVFKRGNNNDNDGSDPDDDDDTGSDIQTANMQLSSSSSSISSATPTSSSPYKPSGSSYSSKASSAPSAHSISNTFVTSEGSVLTSYLTHPPNVRLTSYIATHQGDIQVALHPNYVGPFIVNNAWGQVRMTTPAKISSQDPESEERTRSFVLGPVDAQKGDLYSSKGFNATALTDSATSISGVATWLNTSMSNDNKIPSAQMLQSTMPDGGGQVLVMGGWGDIVMSIDGKVDTSVPSSNGY